MQTIKPILNDGKISVGTTEVSAQAASCPDGVTGPCFERLDSQGNVVSAPMNQAQMSEAVQSEMGSACSTAHTIANTACTMADMGPYVSMFLPGLVSASKSDVAEACEQSADLSKASSGITLLAAGTCKVKRGSCVEACAAAAASGATGGEGVDYGAYETQCASKMQMNEMMLVASAMQALQAMQAAKNCEELVSDSDELFKCAKEPNISDPEVCPDTACLTSMYPKNRDHATCVAALNPTSACPGPLCVSACQAYPDYPQCTGGNNLENPYTNAGINTTMPGIDTFDGTGLGIDSEDNPFLDEEFTGFDGNTSSVGELAKGGQTGGSSLGGGGGGGGAPGGGGGGMPAGEAGYDTDIIGKARGGSGGGGGGGGFAGGYANAGGAWKKAGRAAGTGKSDSIFDLSKFLPKKAKSKRNAASVARNSLSSMGITKSNGLSNFQKVTRMLNKKRPELMK